MDEYVGTGQKGICEDCGDQVVAVECLEEIPDFEYGRPATQKHYYPGSPCCGAGVIKEEINDVVH